MAPGEAGPGGRFSARIEPFWLNPATVKGTLAIAAGLFILFAPNISTLLLRFSIGGVLVVTGGADIWFALRRHAVKRWRSIGEGIVALGMGLVLLFFPTETIRAFTLLVSIYLLVRGLAALTAAIRLRQHGEPGGLDLARGGLYLSVAAVVAVMPEGVVVGFVGAAAAASVIVGAIVLGYGIRRRSDEELIDVDVASVSQLVSGWLHEQDVGHARREAIGEGFFFEEPDRIPKLISWWTMLLLSVAIATFGIIADSTAVVIGAMLIAPLMTPILGAGASIVNAWRGRIISSLTLVLAGAGSAIGLAFVIGQWFPIIVPLAQNPQVVSRVSPNLIDMMIALAAGAAGAYANVDKRVSDTIAGVAIAVALVPPLGVVGLTLQAGLFSDSLGGLLLFLTNLVSIILAATVVFFLTGYAPYRHLEENRDEIAVFLLTVTVAAVVIFIPLTFTAEGIVSSTSRRAIAQTTIDEWIGAGDLSIANVEVEGSDVSFLLSGPDDLPSLQDLDEALAQDFGEPVSLQVEYIHTVLYTYSDESGEQVTGSD